jgi:hypothetical protein
MTKNTASKPKERDAAWYKSLPGAKQSQFVQYELTDGERLAMKGWIHENREELGGILDRLLDSGFSVSVKPDSAHNSIAAFLVPVGENNPYSGWILSGRASNSISAIMGVAYRHLVLFEGTWPTDGANRYRLDDE